MREKKKNRLQLGGMGTTIRRTLSGIYPYADAVLFFIRGQYFFANLGEKEKDKTELLVQSTYIPPFLKVISSSSK